jgi:hypothetical protein
VLLSCSIGGMQTKIRLFWRSAHTETAESPTQARRSPSVPSARTLAMRRCASSRRQSSQRTVAVGGALSSPAQSSGPEHFRGYRPAGPGPGPGVYVTVTRRSRDPHQWRGNPNAASCVPSEAPLFVTSGPKVAKHLRLREPQPPGEEADGPRGPGDLWKQPPDRRETSATRGFSCMELQRRSREAAGSAKRAVKLLALQATVVSTTV